jgi:hypothetical protein
MLENEYKETSMDEVRKQYKRMQNIPGGGDIFRTRPDRSCDSANLL